MASATLPPWLDVTPQAYVGAAEGGERLGLEQAGQKEQFREFNENLGLRRDEMQQNAAVTAAELGQRMMNMKLQLSEFQSRMKQQDLQNSLQIDKQTHDKNIADQELALKQHQIQLTSDWRNEQVKVQKQRYDQAAQTAARKYAAQQQASARIAAGEDPAQVMLELGPELGDTASGLASFYKQIQPQREIPEPDVVQMDGESFIRHYSKEGVPEFQQIRRGAGAGTDDKRTTQLMNMVKMLRGDLKSKVAGSPEQQLLQEYQGQLDKALGISLKAPGQPGAAGAAGAGGFRVINIRPAGQAAPAQTGEEPQAAEEPTPAMQSAPALPQTSRAAAIPEVPEYMQRYQQEVAAGGKDNLSKGAKDYLKDIVDHLSDAEMAQKLQQYNLGHMENGKLGLYGERGYFKTVDRSDAEAALLEAAMEQGWK